MSVSESESRYPETTGYIYSECAKRLKKRKQALNLTDAEIAEGYDRKVVNRILNKTRTRNNPYLVPHAYIQPLMDKLKLQSAYELFWSDADDEQFIETVFCNLLTDILEEERDDSVADIVTQVLLDDVRFAKIQPIGTSSYEAIDESGEYIPVSPLSYLNNGKHPSFAERREIRQGAILRLFRNTRPIMLFTDFFQETHNFSKLDKKLDAFVIKSLMPFMVANLPTEKSLGLRVYSIVSSDLTNYVESELVDYDRTAAGFDKCNSREFEDVLQSLMLAGKDYIDRLEGLQTRLDAIYQKEKFGR